MGEIRRTWTWHFPAAVADLWPVLSDTMRFNEAAGFPLYRLAETPRPDGTMDRLATARYGPLAVAWDEAPFEWVANRGFTQMRRFRNGPLRSLGATLELTAQGSGSAVAYTVTVEPRGLAGRAVLAAGFFRRVGVGVDKLMRDGAAFVAGQRADPFTHAPPALTRLARERLGQMVAALDRGPHHHGAAARLAELVATAGETDAARIRPLALARRFGVDGRRAVELCLAAVRAGMLRMSWDLLCPRCRGAKQAAPALDRLPKGAHCPSCNIDYGADFSRNVEISFQPTPQLRAVPTGGYCLSGPQTTPHVLVQQTLAPGETRDVAAGLAAGDYRLRTLEAGDSVDIAYDGAGFPTVTVDSAAVATAAGPGGDIVRLVNRGAATRTIVVESRDWLRDALTAHRATALQCFRDLFPDQALRPGEDMAVDSVTLMFTDLKGSTALYERIGDGAAYRLVREHFAYLVEIVRRHDGALVKTIGDAVMAVFADPANGIRAALAAQQGVAAFNARQGGEDIVIKLGLHAGPCIAVTLNERLDYFGSTVNLAARLQGESEGGDIVLSEALAADAAVKALLVEVPRERGVAQLKGFDRPVAFARLRANLAARLAS